MSLTKKFNSFILLQGEQQTFRSCCDGVICNLPSCKTLVTSDYKYADKGYSLFGKTCLSCNENAKALMKKNIEINYCTKIDDPDCQYVECMRCLSTKDTSGGGTRNMRRRGRK